jgi:hypothetical protein
MPQIFLTGKGVAKMVDQNVPLHDTSIPSLYEETECRLNEDNNEVLNFFSQAKAPARL